MQRLRRLRLLWLPSFALLVAAPAHSRKHSEATEQNPKTLQVTTRLVQVNVIVKDHRGQLVPGLNQNDFRIFDNGAEQGISDFEVEQTRALSSLPPVPPDISTNIRERAAGASPAVTVVLLDGLNTKWADQEQARRQVIAFLKQIQPDDRVGVYALGTRLVMVHDFTSDSAALVRALDDFRSRPNTEVDASHVDRPEDTPAWADEATNDASDIPSQAISSAISNWVARSLDLEAQYYMGQRVEMTKDALIAIADHLKGVPGRKNLVWLSGAFPLLSGIDQLEQGGDSTFIKTYGSEIIEAANALSDASLAVYPVDARGLMVDPNFSVASLARTNIGNGPSVARRYQRLPTHMTDNFNTMNQVAERTGGRAFYNTNDIKGSIREVIADSRLTYLLAYYPADTVWDGKFHKIKVEVDRPGVRLQYRDGYLAVPEAPATPKTSHQALDAAVLSPLDATGVGLVVKTTPLKSAQNAAPGIIVQYWVDPGDVTLSMNGRKQNGQAHWECHVTLVAEEFGPQRQTLKGVSHQFKFDLNPDQRQEFLKSGLRYTESLPVVAGSERLRVVVRDDATGNLGSVSVPLGRVLPQTGK